MNLAGTLLDSASRTLSVNSLDQQNLVGRFLHVTLDMTTVGTGSVTMTIQGKDVASGKYYTVLAGAAVAANSTNVYRVGPGLTASANAVASDVVPTYWRISIVANNANPAIYSVGYALV